MLVINERAALPRSEQRVLDWMRTWTGQYIIVGLAISGCCVPERHREGDTREADLVVITPRAVVVIEVKGTVPDATSGVLSVQANGRWRLSGFEGDPIQVRDNDTGPFDQVTNNVFNLKTLVRGHHPDAYVDGLIVVVPSWESTITLEVESRQHGCGVVLGSTPGELRAWLHRTSNRKLLWTAEAVHALLVDMNIGDQLTVEDLLAEGFPSATGRRVPRSTAVAGETAANPVESVTEVSVAAVAQAYPDHLSGQFARRNAAQETEVGALTVTTASADSAVVEYAAATVDVARVSESPAHRFASSASTVDAAVATPSAVQQRDSSRATMSEQLVVVTDRADESGTPIEGVLNYVAPLAFAVSAHTDSPPPGSPAPYEAHVSGGADHPRTGTEHVPMDDGVSDLDTAPPVRPGPSPYPDGLGDIPADLEPRRLPESGGQRPPHSLSPRADHQVPWIAPDPDTDSSPVPRAPSTYVRPPWIPPDDDALASPPPVEVQRGHAEPDSDDVRAPVLDKHPAPPVPVEPARPTGTSGGVRESAPEAEVDPSPTVHPASEFTDRWTSWIDDDRLTSLPRRPVPVRGPGPNEPPPAYGNVVRPSVVPPFAYRDAAAPTPARRAEGPSTRGPSVEASPPVRASRPVLAEVPAPVDEPRFLRRNVTVVEPDNRSANPLRAAVTTIRDHVPTRLPSLGDRLPQQLAALAVIALSVGAIWVIVSTGAAEEGASVTPPAQQNQNAEVVGPPGAETPGRSPISLPAVCFPLPTSC
ncbi:nuclease-related domain-containing protein [Nocardia aurea]|uniref:NERD domain-containing protein n=1 Tax=Nocardia aurea TaxID=2144174 RepID=A0ABV3FM70_9NOCA